MWSTREGRPTVPLLRGSASAAELLAGGAAQPAPQRGVQREICGGRASQDYQERYPPGQPEQQNDSDRHTPYGDLGVLRHGASPPSRLLPLSVLKTGPRF